MMRAVFLAFGFLTRLPVPMSTTRAGDAGRSIAFFPLVGLVLGLVLASAAWLAAAAVSSSVLAVGLVALLAALTGGLHLDGLADVVDGLSGGHGDPTRIIAIMHDSRIGAHGAVAVVLLLFAKVVVVNDVLAHQQWRLLVAFPAIARWGVTALVVFFPYVQTIGLGKSFSNEATAKEFGWASAWAAAVVIWAGPRVAVAAAVAFAVALVIGARMQRRLGGLTGDVYGAAIELAELAFLVVAVGRV